MSRKELALSCPRSVSFSFADRSLALPLFGSFDVLLARFRPNRFFPRCRRTKKRRRLPRAVKDLVDRKRRGSDHRESPVRPEGRRGGQTMGGLENNVSRLPDWTTRRRFLFPGRSIDDRKYRYFFSSSRHVKFAPECISFISPSTPFPIIFSRLISQDFLCDFSHLRIFFPFVFVRQTSCPGHAGRICVFGGGRLV